MVKELTFNLIGGLGLFFFGMKIMTDSLKDAAGEKLKSTLELVTRNPVLGLLLGTFITALIQSSSATTVITVGFVNAGLMTLRQAISIILGANIGTTLTAWIVSFFAFFKVTNYALPAIGVGFILNTLGKTQKSKTWGAFILGFGLLFSGLGFIKDSFAPLKNSDAIKNFLVSFGKHPVLGVLAGISITVLFQSSSATIAIVQLMAYSGLIDLHTAIPIILGDNIGTTVTAKLSAIGTNRAARQAANAHSLLNIIGVCYMIIPVYLGLYTKFIEFIVPGPLTRGNIMIHIALAHTVFNTINSVFIFLPLISILEKITVKITPSLKHDIDFPVILEPNLLKTPSIAIRQARILTLNMLKTARNLCSESIKMFIEGHIKDIGQIKKTAEKISKSKDDVVSYLTKLFQNTVNEKEVNEITLIIGISNDVEKIGNCSVEITGLAALKLEKRLSFSYDAENDIRDIHHLCRKIFEETIKSFETGSLEYTESVSEIKNHFNRLQNILKNKHIDRVNRGICDVNAGILFVDFIDVLNRITEHLKNIADSVVRIHKYDLNL